MFECNVDSIKNQCTLAMEAEIRVLRHWHEEVCVAAAAEARKLRQDVDQRRSALKADFDFQCLRLQVRSFSTHSREFHVAYLGIAST